MDWLLQQIAARIFVRQYLTLNDTEITQPLPLPLGGMMPEPEPTVQIPDAPGEADGSGRATAPSDFTPTDGELKKPAPHETAGVLRMFRHGMSTAKICAALNVSKKQLVHELNLAIDDEKEAQRKGQEIYDSRVIVCGVCGNTMNKVQGCSFFRCPGCQAANYGDPAVPK